MQEEKEGLPPCASTPDESPKDLLFARKSRTLANVISRAPAIAIWFGLESTAFAEVRPLLVISDLVLAANLRITTNRHVPAVAGTYESRRHSTHLVTFC